MKRRFQRPLMVLSAFAIIIVLTWPYHLTQPGSIAYNQTTCSPRAFRRGSGQRVIAYSFYICEPSDPNSNCGTASHSDDQKNRNYLKTLQYIRGIKENLALVTKHYPGYVMRVYIDMQTDDPILEELRSLEQNFSNLDLCNVKALPGTPFQDASRVFAMVWRFFPTLDPQVDQYACRDLDSQVSAREAAAVEDFVKSGKSLHSMRDHPHHLWVLMGCCWGANLKASMAREKWKTAWIDMWKDKNMWAARDQHGPDQRLLQDHVWKIFEGPKDTHQHDAFNCEKFNGSSPWPTQRLHGPRNFVGANAVIKFTSRKCPKSCRPKSHTEWLHC